MNQMENLNIVVKYLLNYEINYFVQKWSSRGLFDAIPDLQQQASYTKTTFKKLLKVFGNF